MARSLYIYSAIGDAGKRERGRIRADSEHDVFCRLTQQGLTPVKIRATRRPGTARRGKPVPPAEVAAFTRELSLLVDANIPLASGLAAIAEHETDPRMKAVVTDLVSAVQAGESLTMAFGRHNEVFGDVYIETLRAAEQSGNLAAVITHLADMLDKQIETARQIRRAMTYPLIVMVFVTFAIIVIVVFVVPKFGTIFESNGVELPIVTRLVKGAGDWVRVNWWACIIAVIASVVMLVRTWRSPRGRAAFDMALLRIPHIGDMLIAETTARFSRVLSISLDSGMDLTDSLETAGRSSGRAVFKAETKRMAARMRGGEALSEVIRHTRYLPGFAQRMLSASKDAKELASAARVVGRHYDRLAEHLAKTIGTLIEPLITIALAGIVLLVALSVFLPMWQMFKVAG